MNPIWYDQINFKLSIIERKTTELGSILTCRSLLPSQWNVQTFKMELQTYICSLYRQTNSRVIESSRQKKKKLSNLEMV